MKLRFKKIVVKIGSNVLTQSDGTLDISIMSTLVDQIALLYKEGVQIIIVSSGAVASGRSLLGINKKMDIVDQRQLYSTVGQAKLINLYWDLFQKHGITVGQVLTTKQNFNSRRNYLNQRNCIKVMLENKIIPIINENDAVSVSELMFTDNDELSGLIASMMDMEALFILSNIEGIYTGSLDDPSAKIIREIKKGEDISPYIQKTKSTFGRGGMQTKINIARKIADQGIEVFIANGRKENILIQLMDKNQEAICTHFVAEKSEVSSIKKWIAHSEDFAKGEIYVNADAAKALKSDKAISLLPVGVTKIVGNFEKDDIVRIIDENGYSLGIGKIRYDSTKARELIGKKHQKPLIHYDYMYLE